MDPTTGLELSNEETQIHWYLQVAAHSSRLLLKEAVPDGYDVLVVRAHRLESPISAWSFEPS